MRRWWKSVGVLAGSVLSFGGWLSSANAQFPPPGGGMGMPPGGMGMMPPGGGMGMPPGGMGMMPPGGGMGMPPGGMGMMPPGGGMGMPPGGMGMMPPGGVMGMPTGGMGMMPARGGMMPAGGMPPGMGAEFPNAAPPPADPVSPFSIKDEGMPNAFSDLVDPRCLRPIRWQVEEGYSMLWFRAGHYPALATTGSTNNVIAGALGQSGTKIISGSHDAGMSSAFRTTATYWLTDPETFALEGTFFIMEQRSVLQDFSSDQTGNPVLTRPYFNAVTRAEDADPRALPGTITGTMHDSITTRLMGAEMNLRWCTPAIYQGSTLSFIGGFRFLRLDERYNSYDTTVDVGNIGPSISISDAFTTHNQFYGGQVGLEWQYRLERFTFGLNSKVAVGPNYQYLNISGQTVVTDLPTNTSTTTAQGLFAQPTNIGTYRVMHTSIVPEFGMKMGIYLTDRLKFNLGYAFMLMTNVARPGDQLDRNINIQTLQATTPSAPLVPVAPTTFQQSTFHTHMVNFGLEFLF